MLHQRMKVIRKVSDGQFLKDAATSEKNAEKKDDMSKSYAIADD